MPRAPNPHPRRAVTAPRPGRSSAAGLREATPRHGGLRENCAHESALTGQPAPQRAVPTPPAVPPAQSFPFAREPRPGLASRRAPPSCPRHAAPTLTCGPPSLPMPSLQARDSDCRRRCESCAACRTSQGPLAMPFFAPLRSSARHLQYHILQGVAGPAGCWPHTNGGGVCATAATSTCAFTATSTRTRAHAPRHASNTRRGGNTHAHLRFQFGKWRIAHLRSWPGRLPTCLFKWAMPGNCPLQSEWASSGTGRPRRQEPPLF